MVIVQILDTNCDLCQFVGHKEVKGKISTELT